MTEQMLRDVLRDSMAASTPPPPMSSATMVRVARRARARRRVLWVGAGSGALAATIAVTATALPAPQTRPVTVHPGSSASVHVASPPPPTPAGTAQPFPTGPDGRPQQDRTATAGTRYEQGVQLLDALTKAVPAGYAVPDQPGRRFHEAQFADRVNGVEVWDYLARAAVTRGGGTGQVVAEVHGAGNEMTGDPCTLTLRFWGMTGECTVVTVGSLKVGVVTQVTGSDRRLDQWAGYRHPDGTVVFIAQSRRFDENAPALAALPFPVPQLAALAVDERFHLR